jgi:ribonuclease P protein component
MISRRNRFHGYGSLKYAYQNGRTFRGPLFAAKIAPNPKRSEYRVAVVVSRKVNKSAVARNRIRRRLYAKVRELDVRIKQPADIVLTVYNDDVLKEPSDNLTKQLTKQFQQAGLID